MSAPHSVLLELAALDKWDYDQALRRILRLDSGVLDVERVNFWLLEEDPLAIRCEAGYIRSTQSYEQGQCLVGAIYPRYFAALREEKVIAADRAHHDPRTAEFKDDYLVPLGIGAMMDVPVWSRGRLTGVLCHEHVGGPRPWSERDQGFAMAMAQAIANTLEVRERRRAEAREQAARQEVELRDEFLSVASHELYTPLTSLQLAVEMLRGSQIAGSNAERTLALVERQVRRLTQLVSSLLNVSRIQAGRLELVREEIDLAELARDVSERFQDLLAQAGSAFTLIAPHPVMGFWDRSHLDQVITNLLSNAAKFSVGKPIEMIVERAGDRARLVVRDRGIGIPADRLPRIFERFERGVAPRAFGGLGLGLFIVRGIVERHRGSVHVESVVGKGTIVTVELPTSEGDA